MKQEADPERYRCVYELVGTRCHNEGVWSPSGSTKWYCNEHRRYDGHHATTAAPPPGGFEALRAIVKSKPTDREAELERRAIQDE